jgi:hypothetical protein
MDIYCQKCDEPWDVCYVGHDMDEEGEKGDAERFKRGEGCPSCKWGKDAPKEQSLRGETMSMLNDLLGDDIDGMASFMDDMDYIGAFPE